MKIATLLLGLSLFIVTACGEDAAAKPTCEEIAEACHDSTTTVGMECHELTEAEETTEAECMAERDACLADCMPE